MKVLILGYGFVGKATYLLNNKDIEFFIFDIDKKLCKPSDLDENNLKEFSSKMDLIFISLPTPSNIDGTCYTKIIDNYIKILCHPFIIIRSTVPIGYCDSNSVFFMPEFLTEKNWTEDFINNSYWMFGVYENSSTEIQFEFKKKIKYLINSAYNNKCIVSNNIIFENNKEMEMNKLIRNTFLSSKVSYFNEIYDLSVALKIDYNKVIELVKLDDRIGNTHMMCPGHDLKRGFGGTCFPKDTSSLYFQLMKNNIPSFILHACMDRNENHDRKERDWLQDINRTNVSNNMSKVILVTGGAGFLGRHLCKKLLTESSNKVICLDNLITGSYSNIEEFISNDNFRFVQFDIQYKMFFPHIDEIYHLACIASPDKYKKYSIETLTTCFQGTKNILELAKTHKAKVLYTSTSEVYGDPLIHPQIEEYFGNVNTLGERSCYDEGKRVAETLVYEYHHKFDVDCKIVRLFNTYGPYMNLNDGRVITNFINCILQNKELVIYGDGSQTRSFCFVDDMIIGLVNMMKSQEFGPINLGNPDCEFTLNYLVQIFEEIIQKKLQVKHIDFTENDPKMRRPDIEKAKNKLDFNPKISIKDGLVKTIDFFVKNEEINYVK